MSGIWGEELDAVSGNITATRLYVGGIRRNADELALITRLDRENSIAEVQEFPKDALLRPEWWSANALSANQATQIPWNLLEPLPAKLNLETRVWPPMPVLFSGLISDFTVPNTIRMWAPTILNYLIKSADAESAEVHQDVFVVLPKLYGAPHLAWHRNGHCVVGVNISMSPAPAWYHDKDCPHRHPYSRQEFSSPRGGVTAENEAHFGTALPIFGKNRRVHVFRQYVNESERAFKQVLRQSAPTPARPARLIEVFLNEACHCASIPTNEQAPIAIMTNGTADLSGELDAKTGAIIRRSAMAVGHLAGVTRANVNEHARRITRYGLTAVRKEPRSISDSAKREIRRQAQSTSRVMVRFGPAGSGKTSLLAQLAARLSREGKRVAVVTFTHASRRVVESRVENETIANRALIDYFKVTELLPSIGKQKVIATAMRSQKQLGSVDFTQRMFTQTARDSDDQLDERKPAQAYQALLVDEAEDFTAEMWEYLLGRNDNSNWVGGKTVSQVCVAFDDAQSALGGSIHMRSFESQAPTQWSTLAFEKQLNSADVNLRPEFLSQVDYGWLSHNLRQMTSLANTTSTFRTRFRKSDPEIQPGFVGPDTSTAITLRPTSMNELLDLVRDHCASTEDVIVVCPDRLMVAAATLWMDHPGQLVTQSEFLEDSEYLYADSRGERKSAGVWFEAPAPRVAPVKTSDGEVLFKDVSAENVCSFAHSQLVRLDQTSKLAVNPTDSRARILTYAAARGHEADTAVILIPVGDWFQPELEYIGMTRPQNKLVRIEIPRLGLGSSDEQSEAGRLLAALEVLRVGASPSEAIWPRLQIDVWNWRRDEGLKYLEQGAPQKILDWWELVQKELGKKPEWFGQTHCLDAAFAQSSSTDGKMEAWRDFPLWIRKIRNVLAKKASSQSS